MRPHFMVILLFILLFGGSRLSAQLIPVLGAQRTGTAAAQFLKIGVGARAAGMGESFVAVSNDASALYWNPAGITQSTGNEIIVSHTSWLVDIRHQFVGAVVHLSPDDAVGVSLTSVHMDDMPVTTELQPQGNGDFFRFGDLAVGVTYGRKMTPQFSFGGTVRYFVETLDVLTMRGLVLDFGTYYWMGLGSARFSAVVSQFGNQVSPSGSLTLLNGQAVDRFQEFSPPTTFRFGFAFEPLLEEYQSITTAVQLNHPNDNSENLAFGVEYQWMKTLYARGGYKLNVDEQSFSLGGGVVTSIDFVGVNLDYSYTAFGRLGGVHRISMGARL